MQNDVSSSSQVPRREGVQAIARAALLLRALQGAPEGLGLHELSCAVQLPKSTVHRLVRALASEQLLRTSGGGHVTLGSALLRLAGSARDAALRSLRPVIEQLNSELDETVDLSVLEGNSVRFVDQVPAAHRLRAVSAIGSCFPLHSTANGKALLAALPSAHVRELLAEITELDQGRRIDLLGQLEEISRTGVAFDHEEHTEGVCAVGAAVLDDAGVPVAAISVPVPTPRFRGQEQRYAESVLGAARRASEILAASSAAG